MGNSVASMSLNEEKVYWNVIQHALYPSVPKLSSECALYILRNIQNCLELCGTILESSRSTVGYLENVLELL